MSERRSVQASSLGSYFGVGFNTPEEQLRIDLGIDEQVFDEDSEDRMALGRLLEDGALNYFEYKLGISIVNRNKEVIDVFDGMLRCKIDGETIYNGEDTVVENKISNSQAGVFTKDLGYALQCQAYMEGKGYPQALLLGLYQGRPALKVLKRNDELISDIYKMVTVVYGILNGILGMEEYPWDIVDKYAKEDTKVTLKELDFETVIQLDELLTINDTLKALESRKSEIQANIKNLYDNCSYSDDSFSFTISTSKRGGGFDELSFSVAHPEIDLEMYRKADTETKTMRLTRKKK